MEKGQAALEFLTTYGWALLVVLVMIGALSYFGVLNPASTQSERCVSPLGFECKDYVVNTDGQIFRFKNNLGHPIIVSGGVLDVTEQLTPCSGSNQIIAPDQEFEVLCSKAELQDSETIKAKVSFSYYKPESGPSFTKTASSEIIVIAKGQPVEKITKNEEGWIEVNYVDFVGNHKMYVKNVGLKPWGVQDSGECSTQYCEHTPPFRILIKNNNVTFNEYPAREECRKIGGYLAHANQIYPLKDVEEFNVINTYFWTAAQDNFRISNMYNAVAVYFENAGANNLQPRHHFPSAQTYYTTICVKDS